jgi:hypothetical protein
MNSVEIDNAIRERLAELSVLDMKGSTKGHEEEDRIMNNYLPSVADHLLWEQVVEYAVDRCNPGCAADGRPGRLYSMPDWRIQEAETWLIANPNWRDIMGDLDWDGNGKHEPGAVSIINKNDKPVEVPTAAVYYVSTAFPI